ncbi:MAG: GNAT family N-acetyltransferase [Acidobacteria bacterium]|nr:GNAT family N-acetyltransferase [Acidobacteriota bacterium]
MTETLRIISAASVTLEQFATAFEAAFAGYFFPVTLTSEQLSRRVRFEHLDILRSRLAYDGDELAGMAMLGVRQEVGWVGGLGMTEMYRGRGRSHELMTALIAEARALSLQQLTLEVLRQNVAAIRLYERAGMGVARDLIIFERRADAPLVSSQDVSLLKQATPAELLRHFHRLHLQPPAWQRDLSALLVMDGMHGLYLGARDMPDAYALLRSWPGGMTYIVELAAARKEDADALCAGLDRVEGHLRIINEPESSIFCAVLEAHNFVETERQHEMVMTL